MQTAPHRQQMQAPTPRCKAKWEGGPEFDPIPMNVQLTPMGPQLI